MTSKDDAKVQTSDCMLNRRSLLLGSIKRGSLVRSGYGIINSTCSGQQQATGPGGRKPYILSIMGDDIGWFNISAFNMGIMGDRTACQD